jgi:membrane associated rhomboid family serine protease
MFIPYEVDAPFDHRPVVNWLAILGIVLVFALQLATSEKQVDKSKSAIESPEEVLRVTGENEAAPKPVEKKQAVVTGPMARFALNGWGFGLLTYVWLQGGIIRFIGNLIFLWPFGNAVCGKLGNKLYPLIFLGFALLAGVIHLALGSGPAVGVCSVICGIVGIYVVLFPEDTMSCFVLLPRPMAVSVSGCGFVLLWFIFDILASAGLRGQSTTYYAHILCFGAGFGLTVLMLKKKWLVMEKDEKSLLQMLSKKEETEEIGKEGEKKDSQAVAKPSEIVEKAKAQPSPATGVSRPAQAAPAAQGAAPQQKTAPAAEKPADDFIRFKCECGHRIKIHKKDAGKAGRCPKCSKWLEAPRG